MRRKTTIYLDDDLERDLERAARQRGVSKAEVIRVALREAVKNVNRPVITAIGVGEGPGDVAADVDRHLRDSGFAAE
jgi:predicted transcriptional regulator